MNTLFRQLAECCCMNDENGVVTAFNGLVEHVARLHIADGKAATPNNRSRTAAGGSSFQAATDTVSIWAESAAAAGQLYRLFTFDIETTGLSPAYDAIIELAVVDVASSKSWGCLVRPVPYRKSSKAAFEAHGISDAMLRQPGTITLPAAWHRLLAFMAHHTPPGAKPVLVAHNGFTFDFKMLAACLRRHQHDAQQQQQQQRRQPQELNSSTGTNCNSACGGGIDSSSGHSCSSSSSTAVPEHLLVLDTLHLLRSLKLKKMAGVANLQQATLVEHFLGHTPELCHRALADAQQLAALLPHILEWAAEQADSGLDERLLPRTLASFAAAAAAAAASKAAAATTSSCADGGGDGDAEPAAVPAGNGSAKADKEQQPRPRVGKSRAGGKKGSSSSSSRRQTNGSSSNGCTSSSTLMGMVVAAAAAVELDSQHTTQGSAASGGSMVKPAVAGTDVQETSDSSSSSSSFPPASVAASAGQHAAALQQMRLPAIFASQSAASAPTTQPRAATTGKGPSGSATGDQGVTHHQWQQQQQQQQRENEEEHSQQDFMHQQQPGSSSSSSSNSSSRCASSSAAHSASSNGCPSRQAAFVSPVAAPVHAVMLKGDIVPVLSAAAFMQAVQASTTQGLHHSSSSSSSSSNGLLLRLGSYVQGRADAGSGFCDVLLGGPSVGRQGSLPVAFLLEGLIVSKELKLVTSPDGRAVVSVTLPVKACSRQQQQHLKAVAAAVDAITALLLSQQQQSQQLQQQKVFSCMSGASLQARLPCRRAPPYLDTAIKHPASSRNAEGDGSSSSSGGNSRLVSVPTPCLAAPDAASRLQQLLPVGCAVSLVLWPSCAWSNSKFRGVTLNCLEVWRS